MTTRYVESDVEYFLPEYGPPVRWTSSVVLHDDWSGDEILRHLPRVYYFECDAAELCGRAIHVFADGRYRLVYPGHNGADLPEGALPEVGEIESDSQVAHREITSVEFNLLWSALQHGKETELSCSP